MKNSQEHRKLHQLLKPLKLNRNWICTQSFHAQITKYQIPKILPLHIVHQK